MISKLFIKLTIKIGDLFLGYSISENIKKWSRIKQMPSKELEDLQEKNLKSLLSNVIENVPLYRELEIKLSENPYKDIKKFPIITKDTLRNREDDLISKNYKKEKLLASYSSGSTGVQSRIFMSKKEKSSNWGILLNIWMDQGYSFGDNVLQTGMSPNRGLVKSLKDSLFRTNYINAFSHSERDLKEALLKNVHRKNNVLIGYASSLNVIAEIVLKEKIDLQLKSIISFGDKLFNLYKKNLEKAFNVKVLESYGSNEGLMVAFQKDIDEMYIITPHVYVEILDDDGNPVEDGEMGNIIVTRLDCFSMPLIRYKIGDLGIKLPKEKYPNQHEYNFPLLEKIVGRETDVIMLKNKQRLTVHSFTGIFEYIPEIKQFKVIQENKDGITIEYIEGEGFTKKSLQKAEKELRDKIKDNQFSIDFKNVDYIQPTKSGKPQIVESRIKK